MKQMLDMMTAMSQQQKDMEEKMSRLEAEKMSTSPRQEEPKTPEAERSREPRAVAERVFGLFCFAQKRNFSEMHALCLCGACPQGLFFSPQKRLFNYL